MFTRSSTRRALHLSILGSSPALRYRGFSSKQNIATGLRCAGLRRLWLSFLQRRKRLSTRSLPVTPRSRPVCGGRLVHSSTLAYSIVTAAVIAASRHNRAPYVSDVLLGGAVGFGTVALMQKVFYQCGIGIGVQFRRSRIGTRVVEGESFTYRLLACVVCCGGRSRRTTWTVCALDNFRLLSCFVFFSGDSRSNPCGGRSAR